MKNSKQQQRRANSYLRNLAGFFIISFEKNFFGLDFGIFDLIKLKAYDYLNLNHWRLLQFFRLKVGNRSVMIDNGSFSFIFYRNHLKTINFV